MNHLKKYILLTLLTVIIGSQTFAQNGNAQRATNIIYQSKDGGQTWQDISQDLPENEQPEGFFVGESDLYLNVGNVMYHSKSNLKTPVWEKENVADLKSKSASAGSATSIAFNHSGVTAFNYEGQIYQKTSAGSWSPIHTNFKKHLMHSIFETSDGAIFIGYDHGLYKSADRGQSWKKIHDQGSADMVESEGVLLTTGSMGIMRSTDKGEHWQWVISEGGVGIDVERIDGGFAAISYNTTTQSRRIRISLDKGKTWKAIDEGLQPSSSVSSIKQVGKYLLCGTPDGIFRSSDMGKTWMMVHSGVDNTFNIFRTISNVAPAKDNRKVFKIYVSGYVVYAVARHSGC